MIKITKSKLKQIVKEEIRSILDEKKQWVSPFASKDLPWEMKWYDPSPKEVISVAKKMADYYGFGKQGRYSYDKHRKPLIEYDWRDFEARAKYYVANTGTTKFKPRIDKELKKREDYPEETETRKGYGATKVVYEFLDNDSEKNPVQDAKVLYKMLKGWTDSKEDSIIEDIISGYKLPQKMAALYDAFSDELEKKDPPETGDLIDWLAEDWLSSASIYVSSQLRHNRYGARRGQN